MGRVDAIACFCDHTRAHTIICIGGVDWTCGCDEEWCVDVCDGAWNHTDRVCSIPSPSLPLLPSSLAHDSLHSPPRVIVALILHPFSRDCIAQGCEWVWSDEVWWSGLLMRVDGMSGWSCVGVNAF